MSFVSKVGKAFPGLAPIAMRIEHPLISLNKTRKEIWMSRGEFWMRKFIAYPKVVGKAKVEAKEVWKILKHPKELTYRNIAEGSIFGLQVVGAFCVGEMLGRGSVVGYNVGDHH